MQTDFKELLTWLKKTATTVSTPRKERVNTTLSATQFQEGLLQILNRGFNRLITITGEPFLCHGQKMADYLVLALMGLFASRGLRKGCQNQVSYSLKNRLQ